ncbi:NAD(P)/FAD-dependent oxidoreductase [Pseudonocardia acidicola]|uniref:FAD-dependent oxidoreductase n=1 Tax=Pseudonocardia acidicola TaxID=2724939 RepID=A0ABX1SK23_9PSEU|nr:FAD-dependent oxidoreductase [Pseudonocardia acidicola]NMI01917.1 FAD-dependent oxidoreductase [Pseudonocardia acidicola]
MPDDDSRFVIIGGGLAGAKAAETLRAEGFTGAIALIGDELERPYERPPLSKGYLLGTEERDKAFVHPRKWYAEQRIDLQTGTPVTALRPGEHEVELPGGQRLDYRKLLLVTGARVRRLDVPGAGLPGVYYLRRIEDADALRAVLVEGARVVVIGGGWIGLEVAAAARRHGAEVALVTLDPPLERVLGPEVAPVFADLHTEHGVRLHVGRGVETIAAADGHVAGVVFDNGDALDCGVVVIGIGVIPVTELAEQAGLEVDDGVLVDAALRTSDPDVYAAGDVANATHPLLGVRIRVEHWANALNGGPAAARSMLGQEVSYDRLPYFFSDQYDLGMEYTGHAPPGSYDQVVFRGDVRGREFLAFWLSDGRVRAGMNVNIWGVTDDIQRLIRSGEVLDPSRLGDPRVPLAEL